MRKPNAGMVASFVAHAAVLAYAAIGFSNAKPYDPHQEALPVEVLTLSEFDNLTKGSNISKEVAEKPKVQAKKVAAVTPTPLPPAPEAKEDVAAPPPEPDAAETPPPPEPEKPEPKQADTPPAPEEPEPKQAETPPAVPQPKPANLPKPPEKVAENSESDLDKLIKKQIEKKPEKKAEKKPDKPKPKFDPSKIASLIDKRDPGAKPRDSQEIANVTTAGISSGTASQLSLSMQSMIGAMIQEQLYTCFSPPPGTIGRTDLVATITFDVTVGGVLIGHPQLRSSSSDPLFAAFTDSAMRAVYNCTQPTRPLRLPPEHYDFWRSVTLDFKPPLG